MNGMKRKKGNLASQLAIGKRICEIRFIR